MIFHPSVMVMFTLLLILTACSDDSVTPQLPDQPNPPITQPNPLLAPKAYAGNDTTIYKPFNAIILDGSKSTDPDNNIISYQWKLLSGPSAASVNSNLPGIAFVNGLVQVGNYEFELTVTDADRLSSKDTVVITLEVPHCTTPTKEVIIKDLNWVYEWWSMSIPIDIFSYLPAKSFIKEIYIKRDSSDEWENVVPTDLDHVMPGFHGWVYWDMLLISPHHNRDNDTPDVKIEYCN